MQVQRSTEGSAAHMHPESVARLRRVISRMARQLNASSTEEGLTPSQASVLGVVATHGPMGLAKLGELEGLNPTMLSRIIGRLDELGLMTRRPDPADLRAVKVEASSEGVAVHGRIRFLRTQALAACLEHLPPSTVEVLDSALSALEELADQLRPNGLRTFAAPVGSSLGHGVEDRLQDLGERSRVDGARSYPLDRILPRDSAPSASKRRSRRRSKSGKR